MEKLQENREEICTFQEKEIKTFKNYLEEFISYWENEAKSAQKPRNRKNHI